MNHRTVAVLIMFIASTLSMAQDVQTPADPAVAAVIGALAKSHPVAFSKTVGQEEWYYYIGDEEQFSSFLKLYAETPAPSHPLAIDGQWNKATGSMGQIIRYDWMLRVPASEHYPAVHVSAHSDRIAFPYLVIPESVALVCVASDDPTGKISAIMQAAAWSKGVAAWNDFAAKESGIQWMEMRSAEFSKWLPQYRIFGMENRSAYALDESGKMAPLGSGEWRGKDGEPYRNPKLTSFLTSAHLRITSPDEAISVAKIIEDLTASSSNVAFLKINTLDFRVFDRRFYGMLGRNDTDWKYSAARENGYWAVKKEYVGPPASIMEPLVPHLIVDANDVLMDIENHRGG